MSWQKITGTFSFFYRLVSLSIYKCAYNVWMWNPNGAKVTKCTDNFLLKPWKLLKLSRYYDGKWRNSGNVNERECMCTSVERARSWIHIHDIYIRHNCRLTESVNRYHMGVSVTCSKCKSELALQVVSHSF